MIAYKKLSNLEYQIELNKESIIIINNALNEVCNNIDISDEEFTLRIGEDRTLVKNLLRQFNQMVDKN